MDIVANRQHIAKVRRIIGKLPFVMGLYGLYWRVRMAREAKQQYPPAAIVLSFGQYPQPALETPVTQLCTAAQLLSTTHRNWCQRLHSPARFSRKQWEFSYILQALSVHGMLVPGITGVGFGCGREPLAGLFASCGCYVLATDLDHVEAQEKGWTHTLQHSATIDELYIAAQELVSRSEFDEKVQFRPVDMNAIPADLYESFDFTWSACAFEHLGSLRQGMDFVKNSIKCLKSGGVAVHTTEFNLSSDTETCETSGCSIYRAQDIKQLIAELEAEGYEVMPLNLNTGDSPVDNHIDMPPYGFSPHLKLQLEQYTVTSIGIIIRKPL